MSPNGDAHCHLSDRRLKPFRDQVIQRAQNQGIQKFVLGGYGPEDWTEQLELQKSWGRPTIATCFGLHPWWISEQYEKVNFSPSVVDHALESLRRYIENPSTRPDAVGETGLDHLPKIDRGTFKIQEESFRRHLDLAYENNLPLVLHIIRAHDDTIKILKSARASAPGQRPVWRGLIHSFSGSNEALRHYLDLGFYISLSGSIGRTLKTDFQEAVRFLPVERLLIESDSPDQIHPDFVAHFHTEDGRALNDPTSIFEVAKTVATIKNTTAQKVLEQSYQNLVQLFP